MNQHTLFRPAQPADLPAILEIAGKTGPGFNAIANNAETMREKIDLSTLSFDGFDGKIEVSKRFYFFVLENLENHEVMGISGIEAFIGRPWPFYKYKLSTVVQVSQLAQQYRKHQVIYLASDHEGATELGALYLKPAYRGGGQGTFLARARCLFIAEFPKLFSDRIIADMRGVSNREGVSPFWEALGRHFFNINYEQASYLKATKGSQFLMDLAPRYPIYIDLLPETAQKVIGKTHENTTPALHVLEKEGLLFQNYIDIFDAGPTIETSKEKLKTICESQSAILVDSKEKINIETNMLIGNAQLDFRATLGAVEVLRTGEVILETKVAKRLNVSIGERIRYCQLR